MRKGWVGSKARVPELGSYRTTAIGGNGAALPGGDHHLSPYFCNFECDALRGSHVSVSREFFLPWCLPRDGSHTSGLQSQNLPEVGLKWTPLQSSPLL